MISTNWRSTLVVSVTTSWSVATGPVAVNCARPRRVGWDGLRGTICQSASSVAVPARVTSSALIVTNRR